MDAAATDRSSLAEERLEIELLNFDYEYAVGSTGPTEEEEYIPYTPSRHQILAGYSTPFSAATIKQLPKRAWSWVTSAATGRRSFMASPNIAALTPAGASSRASRLPFMSLTSTRLLSGEGDGSGKICNDGRKAKPSSPGSTHRQSKTSRRETHLLSAETWLIGEGDVPVGTKAVMSSEEKGGGGGEEEAEVAATAVSSGVGLWASRGMLAVVAMLYGTEFGCVKLLQETVPMSLAAALRCSVATVVFLPFLIKTNLGAFRAGVEIGLFDAVGFWAQSKSLMTTTASKAAFIGSLSVLVVPLIDAVLGTKGGEGVEAANATVVANKKRQGVAFATLNGPWFPALLAVAGVACLELIGVESKANSGDAWALGQPLCFGVGFWLTERSARKYPGDMFGIVAAYLLAVLVLAIGWCALAGQIPGSFESLHETVLPSTGSLSIILSLLWAGLMTTSLPVFLEMLAMQNVSAAESTVIFSTEPIWGTVFAAALLGETIGWNTGIGATLIVLACTWSLMGPAIETNVLSFIGASRVGDTSAGRGMVNVDYLIAAVGTDSRQGSQQSIDPV